MDKYPQVILSANVPHYYYTALTLQKAHLLKRYICAIHSRQENQNLLKLLPQRWRHKLNGRDFSELNPHQTKMIWLPELLQRGLPPTQIISRETSNWLNDHIFDFLAQHWIDTCDIFHFLNPVGLYSARRAKAQGTVLLCDIRTEHPDFQQRIVIEEQEKLGIGHEVPGQLTGKRSQAEFELTDYMIVASTYAKRTFIQAGYNGDKIFVVPYGVELNHFFISNAKESAHHTANLATPNSCFRIIYAGQIIPRKGIYYLIRAFQNLALPKSELLLVGRVDKSMEPIIQEAIRQTPTIRVTGNIPKVDLIKYYNASSVFVLPSLADSWGLVVLEAMACGLPVIVTENTGSNEAVQDGENGFIIPIRNVDTLQEQLLYLYNHPQHRVEMGRAAYRSVHNFTWKHYGNRLLEVYNTILRKEKELLNG